MRHDIQKLWSGGSLNQTLGKKSPVIPSRLNDFCKWLENLEKKPVFVAHPVGFDYSFVSWYLWKFAQKNPFTYGQGASLALDLSSFISGKFNRTMLQSRRTTLPDWMKEGMPEHSHNALEDAQGFGVILRNILKK